MGGKSKEFGLQSADYEPEGLSGFESVSFVIFHDEFLFHTFFLHFSFIKMDLQRRGHTAGLGSSNKGSVYWRCYFNAVTCF